MKKLITFFKESIGKEPTTYWNKVLPGKKWENNIAKIFSEFAEWVVNNPDKQAYSSSSLKTDFNLVFLVVVNSIFRIRPETEIINIEDVYNYIVWYYYNYLDYYTGRLKHMNDIGFEGQFCKDIVSSIINELKEKK